METGKNNSRCSGDIIKDGEYAPIGVFDSGFGGLTILRRIRELLPQYDYLYLGDNARAPYGTRSFDTVYRFTLEAVKYLFAQGCSLVILACNTASAKALRSIQQNDLPAIDPSRRVLGVIRPTVEQLRRLSKSGHIGIFGTPGTIASQSYDMEIAKLFPEMSCVGEACPMWVPLIENNEHTDKGADYFVAKYTDELLAKDNAIDTVILGCTHYPLLIDKIKAHIPAHINIVDQGYLVAPSLADYLRRHPEIDSRCSKGGSVSYLSTESPDRFDAAAASFVGEHVKSKQITL